MFPKPRSRMAPAKRVPRVVVLVSVVTGFMAFGGAPANASHVSCGDLITEDTKLDSGVSCPPGFEGPRLKIAADGVTLDLGGQGIGGTRGIGVLNDGHDRVTIRNGSVGFADGLPILIRHANGNRLERLRVGGGGGGILLEDSDDNRVARSTFTADAGGLVLTNGSDRNVIERNSLPDGGGLSLFDSDDNVVRRNLFSSTFPTALQVGSGADSTTVARNELLGGCCRGILVHAETQNTLLVRNQVSGYFCSGECPSPSLGQGNGIRVESAFATLTRNSSNDNEVWGIFAVPGVIDGGHNTASGNGVGQCLNVTC